MLKHNSLGKKPNKILLGSCEVTALFVPLQNGEILFQHPCIEFLNNTSIWHLFYRKTACLITLRLHTEQGVTQAIFFTIICSLFLRIKSTFFRFLTRCIKPCGFLYAPWSEWEVLELCPHKSKSHVSLKLDKFIKVENNIAIWKIRIPTMYSCPDQ